MTTKRTAKQNAQGQATNRHLNRASYQRGNEQSADEFQYTFGGQRSLRPWKRANAKQRGAMLAEAIAMDYANSYLMGRKWPESAHFYRLTVR